MRKILIVGGGYAGFYTAWKLEKKLRRREAQVTIIDPRPYMTYQPFLPEVMAGSIVIAAFASHFWIGMTLTWIQTNRQSSVLISRAGAVVTVVTIDASAHGIDQIFWIMRPSKLTAIAKSYETKINRDLQTP